MSDKVTISLDTETKNLLSQIVNYLKRISEKEGLSGEVQHAMVNIEKHLAQIAHKPIKRR